uniref:Uncharacterized protein n=2 Tax=Cacopsylla melanoneura TaxID=428564 RepID=A0A8D8SSR4_9HEMI
MASRSTNLLPTDHRWSADHRLASAENNTIFPTYLMKFSSVVCYGRYAAARLIKIWCLILMCRGFDPPQPRDFFYIQGASMVLFHGLYAGAAHLNRDSVPFSVQYWASYTVFLLKFSLVSFIRIQQIRRNVPFGYLT